jgi:hypothetical protein
VRPLSSLLPSSSRAPLWLTVGLTAALLAGCLAGCNGEPGSACPRECSLGTACDESTGVCEPIPLSRFDGALPGRAIGLAVDADQVFAAVIDPSQALILVGHLTRDDNPEGFRILHRLPTAVNKRLAVASSTRHVSVVWLEASGRYRLALRPAGASNLEWTFMDVVPGPQATSNYTGSEHFTVVLDESNRIQLLFFDADRRGLRRLQTATTSGVWELDDVDDGMTPLPLAGCAVERRAVLRRGVGWQPDAIIRPEGLFVAYHDADCGDLRLARRTEGRWVVSVVDNGEAVEDPLRAQEPGVVGRFPSIAANSRGELGIAYQDVSRGRVLYVRVREGEFIREVADSGVELDAFGQAQKQLVGAFTRLVYDRDDVARLVYMNGTLNTLRRAQRQADASGTARWIYRSINSPGPVGFFADLLLHPLEGKVFAAERLVPGARLESQLVLSWEDL